MPECQKINNDGLKQYGAERFGRFILPQSEKNVGPKALTGVLRWTVLTWYINLPVEHLEFVRYVAIKLTTQREKTFKHI